MRNKTDLSDKTIIIAGLGRCGTWLMTNSIFNNTSVFNSFFRFNDVNLMPGYVYKTHDFPPDEINKNIKIIYMFGNPMNVVLSAVKSFNLKGKSVIPPYTPMEGFYKFHNADYKKHNEIFIKDTLRLEENFDKWYKKQSFSFVSLKYETLYETDLSPLFDYLGFKFTLPKKKRRKTNWKHSPYSDILLKTYGQLNDKIENADNLRIFYD